MGIAAQQKSEGDVTEGDAREGGEQGGAGQPASQVISAEGPGRFNQSRAHAGHHAGVPGVGHGIGFRQACVEGGQLHRQHHQKHVGEQAHGVDAVGQGRAVVALLPRRQAPRQVAVGEVAHQQADAGGGQDRPEDQGIGIAQHAPAEADDQQNLNQVVEPQGETAIQVAGPPWTQHAL